MTDSIRWLTLRMVLAFHRETLQRHGGSPGVRDIPLLESALARPQNRAAYDDTASLFDLTAEYCAGIIGNHPFVDGNKRTGLLASVVFLSLNGYALDADEAEIVTIIEAVAAGGVAIAPLAAWFDAHCHPAIPPSPDCIRADGRERQPSP
jgi:death on curing protein